MNNRIFSALFQNWEKKIYKFDLFINQNLMQSASVKSHKLIANGKRWRGITKYERFSHTKPINNTKCQWRQAAAQTTQETINVRTIEIRITNHNNIFFYFSVHRQWKTEKYWLYRKLETYSQNVFYILKPKKTSNTCF